MQILSKRSFPKLAFFLIFCCLCSYSFAAGQSQAREPLQGILVEGMDFAGKSTVCTLLQEKLSKQKIKTKLGYCYLSDNFLIRFLLNKAIGLEGTEDGSLYHACATIMDAFLFKPDPRIFYVQDRNWLSQECWLEFFCPGKNYAPENYFRNNSRQFAWNVYLSLSYNVFRERYEKRTKKSYLNRLFFADEAAFEKYNDLCLSKILPEKKWLVINTDLLTPDQVADQILEYCNLQ